MNVYRLLHTGAGIPGTLRIAVLAALVAAQMGVAGPVYSKDTTGNGSASDNGQEQPQNGEQLTQDEIDELASFYLDKSMLGTAQMLTAGLVGDPAQWNGPYMHPEPDLMTDAVAEFLTLYPRSYLPANGESVLRTLASPELWQALSEIGITLMHPVAIMQAGSIVGRELQDSVDGGFDRIALVPEPEMGTVDDVRALVEIAMQHDAIVAGDIIPLHLGAGYDFRLAEMGYGDYAGIFDMIEIPEEYWDEMPDVDDQWGFTILLKEEAQPFIDAGLIPGMYDVLLGREESTDWSGWAATAPILGVDGETRRWLYAFLFKPEQPALNWMDPTYNARIIQSGDIVRHVVDWGMVVNRLDAVPFLGLEPLPDSDRIDIFTTPLAINGTEDLAFLHRKMGGWTWVELNVPAQEYGRYMEFGPDIGYDFFTRAQTLHPLITADARVLSVAHRSVIDAGVDHSRLIHAMQNHDEIAYQLINLRFQDQVEYGDETISGTELADRIEQQMQDAVAGEAAPFNALYRPAQNGVATTYAGFIAPALGIDPYEATPEEVETIKQAHVMLAVVNAMQPGVFAVSQWDLVGALPLDRSLIQDRIDEGDMRWLNRGGVDLMGVAETTVTPFGLPEAEHLYPPLPEQLTDSDSFASQVASIIGARKRWDISDAEAVAAPDVEPNSVFALLMRLPSEVGGVAVTAANYSQESAEVTVDLSPLLEGSNGEGSDGGSNGLQGRPHDIVSGEDLGSLSGTELSFEIEGLTGVTIVIGGSPIDDANGNGNGDGDGNGNGSDDGNGNGNGGGSASGSASGT